MATERMVRLLAEEGISFAIVADISTGEVRRVGDPSGLPVDDLANSLFGDVERVLATNRSLEGQLLPRTWCQGGVCCIVCKPCQESLIGVFCDDKRGITERYHWAKSLDAKLTSECTGSRD
jgi:hypothetical protein